MRKIVGLITCVLGLLPAAFADISKTHLETLKSSYPYGLIGDDYGLLTEEDLAVNTCGVLELTPFSGEKNMAYPYWQCFPVKDTKLECDSMGYDRVEQRETGHMEIVALGNGGFQSYLARNAMNMRVCKRWHRTWSKMTEGEKYVCLSGPYGAYGGIRDGLKETGWRFEKFKTRKGCESFGARCSLKERKNAEEYCHLSSKVEQKEGPY